MIDRNINSMIKFMQNRKQSKDEQFFLPNIRRRNKYNQPTSPNLGVPNILSAHRSKTDQVKIDRQIGQFRKGMAKLNGIKKSNSMRKVKNYYGNKQNQNDLKRSMRFLQKKIHLYDGLKADTKLEMRLQIKKIDPIQKPPHRYKTAILVFKHCLLLYGGLGCEKNLTWAKLNFQNMAWQISRESTLMKPINSYVPSSPLYGHTMTKYKDFALVYGGHCSDEVNEITIINTKNMNVIQGSKSPFRRKEHAAAIYGDFLVVHGGIESRETKNQLFLYNILSDKWITLIGSGLPALSSHKMVKGKNRQLYIFGGLNPKGKSTNKLYKIRSILPQTGEVKWEQVDAINSPRGRYSFCFEQISSIYLLLYGGREQTQSYSQAQALFKGIFNDIQIYNIEKKWWKRICQNESLQYCFGMGSTSSNSSIFIFGGSNHKGYCDARINLLWNANQRNNVWESVQGSQGQISSSKRISTKIIS